MEPFDPAHDPHPGQRAAEAGAGAAPSGRSGAESGPPGWAATGAGPDEWPDVDMPGPEPVGPRRPPREPDGEWTPPAPPDPPIPAAASQPPARPHDDFWDRISGELAAEPEAEPASPPRPATGPLAMGGDLWSRPADKAAEAGSGDDDAGPGRPAEREASRDIWSAWAPKVSARPGAPSADDEDGPQDHADADAHAEPPALAQRDEAGRDEAGRDEAGRDEAGRDEAGRDEAGRDEAGRDEITPDEVPDRMSAAAAAKEAGAQEEEAEEEEEAAPSPWSIPLTLVGDLDLDEDDDWQPAGPDSPAEDGGTETSSPAGERPVPERAGSDLWSRPTWAGGGEKTRTGPAEPDGESGREEPDQAGRAGADAAAAGASLTGGDVAAGRDDRTSLTGDDAVVGRAGRAADAGDAAAGAGGRRRRRRPSGFPRGRGCQC